MAIENVVGEDIVYEGYVVAKLERGVPASIMAQFLSRLKMGGETPPFQKAPTQEKRT